MRIRCWVWKSDPDEDDVVVQTYDANTAIDVASAMFGVPRTSVIISMEEQEVITP